MPSHCYYRSNDTDYRIAKPLPFNAGIVEGRFCIHLGPFCLLRQKMPETFDEMFIEDECKLENHILICTESFRIFYFISTMRSASLKPHEIAPIVVLSPNFPTHEYFPLMKEFPQVYFMAGDPSSFIQLKRANYLKTSRIVLLSLNKGTYEEAMVRGLDDTRTM
jgi:hypothetical protein